MGECDVNEMVESDADLFAGSKWVEEVFGFMLAWNSSLYEAVLTPKNMSALNLALTVWRVDIPVWAVCLGCIVLYG
jgi:amino acid transporter